jgi:hypothetical protein
MSGDLDFLDDDAPTPEVVEVQEVVVEPVAAETQAVEVAEPVVEDQAVQDHVTESQVVPRAALLAEREKRQAFEARIAQLEADANVGAANVGYDPYAGVDPYALHAMQQVHVQRYKISELQAAQMHGADLVREAKQWAIDRVKADPLYDARVDRSDDPFTVIVEDFRREQILSQITPDIFKEFQAFRAAQAGQPLSSQPAASVAASPKPAFTSLKTVATAGGVKQTQVAPVVTDHEVFNEAFP